MAAVAQERRALARQYLAGEIATPRDLLTAQTQLIREHASGLGFDRLAPDRQAAVIDYVRATLRSQNAGDAAAHGLSGVDRSALGAVADEVDAQLSGGATASPRDRASATARERWGTAPEVHTRTTEREIDPDRLALANERVRELGGDDIHRFAQSSRAAWDSLPTGLAIQMQNAFEAERRTLGDMARRYVNGQPSSADAPLIRSAAQLIDEQVAHLRRRFAESGRNLDLRHAGMVENAVTLDVQHLNATVAEGARLEHLSRNPKPTPGPEEYSSPPGSPEARATYQRPRRIPEALEREAREAPTTLEEIERHAGEAMNALPQEGRTMIARLNRHAGEEIRSLRQSFLDGTATAEGETLRSSAELMRAQLAAVDEVWNAVGPGAGVDITLRHDIRQAITLELRRANAQALVDLERGAAHESGHMFPAAQREAAELRVAGRRAEREASHPVNSAALLVRVREAADALGRDGTHNIGSFDDLDREIRGMMRDDLPEHQVDRVIDLIQEHEDDLMHRVVRGMDEGESAAAARGTADAASMLARMNERLDTMVEQFVARGNPESVSRYQFEIAMRAHDLPDVERHQFFELMNEHWDDFQARADTAWREATEARRVAEAERVATHERTLKPSDERAAPAVVDGVPFEAATRLDDALEGDLMRFADHWERAPANYDDAFVAAEALPRLEQVARQFARDNPNLISEADAVAYAARRGNELGDEEAILRLREDGGHARSAAIPEPDEDALRESIEDMVRDHAYDQGGDEYASFDRARVLQRFERSLGPNRTLTRRERALAEEIIEGEESTFDEIVAEDRRVMEEEADADRDPDSEPERSPDSNEGHERFEHPRGTYYRVEDDGLPANEELVGIGLNHLEVNSNSGTETVFGRGLDVDEVRDLFSLEHLQEYGDSVGKPAFSKVEVHRNRVEFQGGVGTDFRLEVTYKHGDDGLEVDFGLLKLPPEIHGTGVSKAIFASAIPVLEKLGGGSVEGINSAWIGQYTWLALGLQPSEDVAAQALASYENALAMHLGDGHPAVAASMARIKNTRDIADAWLPRHLIEERLPELRQGWAELEQSLRMYHHVELQPFDESLLRTSRSGNEQFLSGKYFLLTKHGPWHDDLRLDIAPGTAWYDEFKKRIGLGAGVLGLGLSAHELIGAFSGAHMKIKGVGEPTSADAEDQLPHELQAALAEHQEKFEKVERTREKLGYLKTETEIIARDTARAIANPNPRERVVAAMPGVTGSQGIARFLGSHGSLKEAFDDKREVLSKMGQNPMLLVDELTEGLSEVQEHAPELHGKMVQQTYKVVQYLQTKLPGTIGASLTRPEGSPANALAMRQFALYFSAATDPSSVMGDLANNRARREQIDTLREVWPDVYQDLKLKVVEQLSQGRPTINQRNRLDLLFDFGEGLDRALSPRLVQTLAAHRAKPPAGDGQTPGGAPGGGKQAPSRRTQPSVGGTGALGALALGPGGGSARG
jgi:hypothetical protein